MTRLWNTLGLTIALCLATLAGVGGRRSEEPSIQNSKSIDEQPDEVTLSDGQRALRDASQHLIPLRDYRRIASASTSADSVLLDLTEPDRIVAFTTFNAERGWHKHRYAGKAHIDSIAEVEAIIGLKPDLVLANVQGSEQAVARLKEQGITVFDLGEMRGVDSFVKSVRTLSKLVGKPDLAEDYIATFRGRLERIAAGLPVERRKTAAYAAVFGQKIFGSGKNTSFADVLHYAGLVDEGANHYQNFPEYGAEQLLSLNPDLLVTHTGMHGAICNYPGLERLGACTDPEHRILELPETVIGSTGAEMLIAAEQLHAAAYDAKSAPDSAAVSR